MRGVRWALLAYAAAFPFMLFFALEGLNPTTTYGLMAAPWQGWGIILFSALFITLGAAVVFTFTASVFWSYVVVSAVLGVAYVVNNLKLAIAGYVFVPTDLMIAGEAMTVTDIGAITIERVLLLRIFVVMLLHVPLLFVKFKPDLQKRFIIFSGAIAIFLVTFVAQGPANRIMAALGVDISGPITAIYSDTGFIVGFHAALLDHNARSANASAVAQTAMDFFSQPITQSPNAGVRPNVIVIMSEAFMDPTVIYNLEFSTDPTSNLRRLSQDHISGQMVVPVFGGRTANTEFEFLTGVPLFFMGSAYYVPYNSVEQYFFRDVTTAMPWTFRKNGYHTVAVHPYYREFWRRHQVYPRLGFDVYIGYEDMEDPQYKGPFVSDEFFTDQIIEQIILADDANQPLFLFGISMQNHWRYDADKYDGWPQDVTAASHLLDERELASVDAFLQGLYDADKQLGRLVDFIETTDTPTIVVFFSDHLPIVGEHGDAIFQRLGYISDQRVWLWNEEDRQKMFTVPYLVWSNFADGNQDWGTISPYLLAAQVLHYSGVALSPYWHHVLYANQYFGALTENHFVDIYGNFHGLYGVRDMPVMKALDALQQVKWSGTGEIHQTLGEIIEQTK